MNDKNKIQNTNITFKKYPDYLDAVEKFLNAGFKEGDIIEKKWFVKALGLPEIDDSVEYSGKYLKNFNFLYMERFENLRKYLLVHHSVDLVSKRGVGYIYMHPKETIDHAVDKYHNDLRKSSEKQIKRLIYSDLDKLDNEDRQRNVNAQAHIAKITRLASKEKDDFVKFLSDQQQKEIENK